MTSTWIPPAWIFPINPAAALRSLLIYTTYISNLTWSKVNSWCSLPNKFLLQSSPSQWLRSNTLGPWYFLFSYLPYSIHWQILSAIPSRCTPTRFFSTLPRHLSPRSLQWPLDWFSKLCFGTFLSIPNTLTDCPFKIKSRLVSST